MYLRFSGHRMAIDVSVKLARIMVKVMVMLNNSTKFSLGMCVDIVCADISCKLCVVFAHKIAGEGTEGAG